MSITLPQAPLPPAAETQAPGSQAPEMQAPESAALGIGAAATQAGVSERALRYWEQIGLLSPSARTSGGMRRYSPGDLERVARIRELQDLMGFNLDEIRSVLDAEDHLDQIRLAYHAPGTDADRQQRLLREALLIRAELEGRVESKLEQISQFLGTLREQSAHVRGLLAD